MKKIYTLALIALTSHFGFGAELFIRVTRAGSHAATVASQMQSNSTNIFRFFELPGGNTTIQVTDQFSGTPVFYGFMNIAPNQRIVGEINSYGNFSIIETTTIGNVTSWYTPGTVVYVPNPSYPNGGSYSGPVANTAGFSQFLAQLDDEAFDSDKLTIAKAYTKETHLSAQQIADISRKFTFDSNRLDWAKHAYSKCYDKANYFLLKSTFSFSSNYSALVEYIEGQ